MFHSQLMVDYVFSIHAITSLLIVTWRKHEQWMREKHVEFVRNGIFMLYFTQKVLTKPCNNI